MCNQEELPRCPYVNNGCPCVGSLQYITGQTTCIGIIDGVDDNEVYESFKCDKCNRTFVRSWKWEEQIIINDTKDLGEEEWKRKQETEL